MKLTGHVHTAWKSRFRALFQNLNPVYKKQNRIYDKLQA